MVSKLWQLSLKMLLVKRGRTFFSILAIALSVGLLCSMFQLHMLFNQDLQQRLEDEYGSADIRMSSPAPTGNLDSNTTDEVLELFERMRDMYEQTILLVTHEPDVAARADRIIYIKDGMIEQEWRQHVQFEDRQQRLKWLLDQLAIKSSENITPQHK